MASGDTPTNLQSKSRSQCGFQSCGIDPAPGPQKQVPVIFENTNMSVRRVKMPAKSKKLAPPGATDLKPADFPLGSLQSRAAARALVKAKEKDLCLKKGRGSVPMAGGTDPDCPIKNWAKCAWICRGYDNHQMLSRFCLSYPNRHVIPLKKKRGVKTLEIELVQTKELAYELSGSR